MTGFSRMVRRLSALLLLLACVAGAGEPPLLADELEGIDRLLAAGRGAEALVRVDALTAQHGADPLFGWQLRERRGIALLQEGQLEAALPLLEETVQRRPFEPGGHRNLADALRRLGRRGRALAEYTQAVELAPLDADLRLELAHYLAEFGQWRRAGIEFRTALTLGAGSEADRGLAVALQRQGQPAAAVAPLRRLHLAAPSVATRRQLAAALQAARRDSELVALLAPVDGASLDTSEFLALVQAEGRRADDPVRSRDFVRDLAAGQAPAPVADHALFWARVGLNLIGADDWEGALAATTRAVELDPDNVAYRNNRLVVLQHLGHHAEASREWDEILRLDPQRKGP